ncbi:hypothetical protein Tco_1511201 [Tanacetum coccineum]
MCAILHSFDNIDEHTEMQCLYLEKLQECECLEIELSKQNENVKNKSFDELSKKFAELKKHCISLELSLQCINARLIHRTSVSRPQLRSTQMKEKVVPNNSQVKIKKKEVEDHHRISSFSNKTNYVIACNDSLKSKTSNVNVVCVTCGKCVFNSNHDACVSKFINDVNARTKKPKVVPISTRKPIIQSKQSVVTPHKKMVASKSTIQKSKSYFRMLYENTSKTWTWWIEKQYPSRYKWMLKTKKK